MALMPSPLEERHLKINTFQSLSLHREITLGTRAEAEGPSAQVILRLEKKAVILSTEILLMHTEGRRERERERENSNPKTCVQRTDQSFFSPPSLQVCFCWLWLHHH